jgi:hypothetical protein
VPVLVCRFSAFGIDDGARRAKQAGESPERTSLRG